MRGGWGWLGEAWQGLQGMGYLHRKEVKGLESIKLPRWKELVDKARGWDYGTIYSHEEIAEIMQIEPYTAKYYAHVSTANRHLLFAGKRLKNISSKGYQVLNPDDYTSESARKVDQAKNKVKQALSITAYAPVEFMSEEGKKRHILYTDRLAAFAALTQGGTTELKILAAKDKIPRIQLSK